MTIFFEQISSTIEGCFSEISIDLAGKRIKNVALVGTISKNNRRYLPGALMAGVSKYEGAKVFIDHPSPADERRGFRSARDLAGKIENARFDGGKIRGDIKLLNNEGGRLAFEIAANMPGIAGMSHNAYGKFRRENGMEIVESIERVVSVDVVTEPATNDGFFEAGAEQPQHAAIFKLLSESGLPEVAITEAFRNGLLNLAEQEGFEEKVLAAIQERRDFVKSCQEAGDGGGVSDPVDDYLNAVQRRACSDDHVVPCEGIRHRIKRDPKQIELEQLSRELKDD